MTDARQEQDSLGSIQVPKDAFYGAQTARALHNYQLSGRTTHLALIRAYLRIKSAAARANQLCGVLDAGIAARIFRATEQLLSLPEHKWPEIFPLDPLQSGAGTNQNMNVNEVIAHVANRLTEPASEWIHPNDHVNRSQSTNDTYPTAMHLALLEVSTPVIHELTLLENAFHEKARDWLDLPKAARTHLQDAVPITLGQEFGGYAETLHRCTRWIRSAQEELLCLGIGGSATGTGLTVPTDFPPRVVDELRRMTHEKWVLAPNFFDAMQSQSAITYFASMLKITALELTRICNDLRLLASGPLTGFGEISLPVVQPGSSIMPGKINPSILEAMNQTLFMILGYEQTTAYAAQAGQLELNVMMPVMAHANLEAADLMSHGLRMLRTRCIEGIRPNPERLRRYFETTPQVATALSPKLGYDTTAKLVQEALRLGKGIIELVRERRLLSEAELNELLDARALTGRKAS